MPEKNATALSRSHTSRVIGSSRLHDFAHALLDARQIIRRERLIAGEIVVEAGFGRRAEGDLRLGVQLLDRLGHHMRRVVAQDFDPLRRRGRDDRDRGVMVDHRRQIAQPGRRS